MRVPVMIAAVLLLAAALTYAAPKGAKTWQFGQWSDMQQFTASGGQKINYYLFTPKAAEGGKKVPLVVWLHGGVKSNGVGSPSVVQDAFYKDEHQKDHPCFVLRPVAVQGTNWVSPRGAGTGSHKMPAEASDSMKAAVELIDKIIAEQPIDTARLYVCGASMGGYGTWDIIERYPNKFAAAIPICGGADPSKAEAIKHVPVWIFHGDKDPWVPVKASREMFDALLKARNEQPVVTDEASRVIKTSPDGKVRYIEYKGAGHNPAWDKGLNEEGLIDWVFGHSLAKEAASAPASRPAE